MGETQPIVYHISDFTRKDFPDSERIPETRKKPGLLGRGRQTATAEVQIEFSALRTLLTVDEINQLFANVTDMVGHRTRGFFAVAFLERIHDGAVRPRRGAR